MNGIGSIIRSILNIQNLQDSLVNAGAKSKFPKNKSKPILNQVKKQD